jgi:hypothetical protein
MKEGLYRYSRPSAKHLHEICATLVTEAVYLFIERGWLVTIHADKNRPADQNLNTV